MQKYLKKTIEFYNKNVDEYIKNTITLQDSTWLEKFIKYLPKNGKILDIGCAYGRDCKYFVEKGFKTYGIDLSEKMIEHAKVFELKAHLAVMDMLNLKFENQSFDGIWCSATLLHLNKNDALKAIKKMNRVLKKKGVLFLNLKEGIGEKVIKDLRYNNSEKFYSYFSEKEIKRLLEDESFSIIDFEIIIKKDKYMQNSKLIYLIARKI